MAVTYEQVLSFLAQKEPEITQQQAERLVEAAFAMKDTVDKAATQLKESRAKADELAKSAGFSGVDEMIRKLGLTTLKQQSAQMREAKSKSVVVRKPYMSPHHPDRIFSCASHHATPPELSVLLKDGWEKSELHYKNLAAACRARGVELSFDPIKRHAQLAAQERQ